MGSKGLAIILNVRMKAMSLFLSTMKSLNQKVAEGIKIPKDTTNPISVNWKSLKKFIVKMLNSVENGTISAPQKQKIEWRRRFIKRLKINPNFVPYRQ